MKSAIVPAVVLCGLGVFAATGLRGAMIDQPSAAVAETPAYTTPARQEHVIYASGQTAHIRKEADGHFWATAYVNSMPVRFLIDTGATAVVLTERDARSIGVDPDDLPRRARVMTAAGEADAGVVTLGLISIEGLEANDIDAVVMDDSLQHSLLGMNFLNRFSHWEASREAIVIRR